MPFLAWLKLVSPREWLAIAVACLAIYGAVHFYRAGEAHVKAADAQLLAAREKDNAANQIKIGAGIAAALEAYRANTPPPPPAPAPRLVCRAASGGPVSDGGAPAVGGNGAGAAIPVGPAPADAGFDPAPAVSATGTAADREIARLKSKISLLQGIIAAYQKGGLVAR